MCVRGVILRSICHTAQKWHNYNLYLVFKNNEKVIGIISISIKYEHVTRENMRLCIRTAKTDLNYVLMF